MIAAGLLLAAVTVERAAELALARRNTASLMSQGAHEVAPGHYRLIVLLHATWLIGLWLYGFTQHVSPIWLAVFLGLQILRIWVLWTLGRRWTTRIIILPKAPLVTKGPFQFFAHPNYLVVVGEIAVLPLCLGLPAYAAIFSCANALVLLVRIRSENAALSGVSNVSDA